MRKWNIKQKQLIAEGVSNLAVGIVLIGGVTPIFTEIKNVKMYAVSWIIIVIVAIILYFISLRILEK